MATTAPDDLLVLQGEIVELLKAALADVRPAVHVLEPADLASDGESSKLPTAPAVNVVYMGHRFSDDPNEQRSDGTALMVRQLFVVEVVTRNVASLKAGSAARREGGKLAMQVLRHLMGARLPSASGPLLLKPGPGPVYKSGLQFMPLMFQGTIQVLAPKKQRFQ